MNITLFDDQHHRLGPLTDLRAVADLRTGAYTNHQRLTLVLADPRDHAIAAIFVPGHLRAITQSLHPDTPINPAGYRELLDDQFSLLINAALTRLTPELAERLLALEPGHCVTDPAGRVVAACLSPIEADAFVRSPDQARPESTVNHRLNDTPLIARPWDVIARLEDTLRDDLALSPLPAFHSDSPLIHHVGAHPVKVAASAKLHPMVVLNSEKGPIVVDEKAIVGSFSVIAGPCYIGPSCIIAPHAHIRANTAFGPHCVLGGEISQTVIQGRTNKCHEGYLGHSYVGQWVNLGAGTTVSNLKNTYGTIRVQLTADQEPEDSGQVKQGPIIGDFVRTAIGSRLMTGSVVGTASMIATEGYAPKFLPPLTFHTDAGSSPYQLDKLIDTLNKAMARRDQSLSDATQSRLAELAP